VASLDETLRRLRQERDEADRRYNEALTALDQAGLPPPSFPDPPAPYDASQAATLNAAWRILDAPAAEAGVRGRLKSLVRRVVGPYLQQQVAFNSWLVDHLNRNLDAGRRAEAAAVRTTAALRAQADDLAAFRAHLIAYLQQMTLYVDTRDRDAAGGALVLNAAINGVADGVDKRAEVLAGREARLEARLARLEGQLDDVRSAVAVAQQAAAAVKRRLETAPAAATSAAPPADAAPPAAEAAAFAPSLDAYKYVAFEDRFRGARDDIAARLASYLPFFAGASEVLDVGCGRGEFLELLAGAGIRATGIDLNPAMVDACRERGLDATHADAVGYLTSLEDGSLGGLFAAQVVEHLKPAYLLAFLDLAFRKLRPGAHLVLETLNPACWVAFFESYIRDITHAWPLHPETLKFLVLASGFGRAELEYRSPVAAADRLAEVAVPAGADAVLADLADTMNANAEKLNARLFTHLDYAVIGTR
jgi:SAM-dependent methyltransferase